MLYLGHNPVESNPFCRVDITFVPYLLKLRMSALNGVGFSIYFLCPAQREIG